MTLFDVSLLAASFLCAITAGLLFTFTVVVMPGIRSLPDRDFLRAFKAMDRVIQQNEPRFVVVWAGSVIALIAALLTGVGALAGAERLVLIGAVTAYLVCVQLPTIVVHIPLNNRLQAVPIDGQTASELRETREAFEVRWITWNSFRTVFACLSVFALLVLLLGSCVRCAP